LQHIITVLRVPKLGGCLIRFLGNPSGMLVHRIRNHDFPCPGEEDCKDHDLGKWKGYAPAQAWDPKRKLWVPVVFELTQGAVSCCGTANLRGQGWEFRRVKTAYAQQEVQGRRTADYDIRGLSAPFEVQPIVQNMLKTNRILWDVSPDQFLRATAETADDAPELLTSGQAPILQDTGSLMDSAEKLAPTNSFAKEILERGKKRAKNLPPVDERSAAEIFEQAGLRSAVDEIVAGAKKGTPSKNGVPSTKAGT
jgi:hypothetical protein